MPKGLLFHLCCSQAHAFDATRLGVEMWMADCDPFTLVADLQEWVRRCGKVRDEVNGLFLKACKQAAVDPAGFPETGAAFLATLRAGQGLLAAVAGGVQLAARHGHGRDNFADLERIAREVAQTRDKFAAKVPGLAAPAAEALASYRPQAARPTADTVGELELDAPAATPSKAGA